MSDEIFDGIFPIVHRTFPFCWVILEADGSRIFFVLKLYVDIQWSGYRVGGGLFFLNHFNSMGMSFVTKLNFWRRKIYKIRLDSFLSLSWFAAAVNTTHLLVQIVLKGLRAALVRVRSCKCHVFELFLFKHIVRKWQCLLSLFINRPLTME